MSCEIKLKGMDGSWTRHDIAETVMAASDIKSTVKLISLDDVNDKRTLHNPGRFARVVKELQVQDYADGLERGDRFPIMVAAMIGGFLTIISGVHRYLACKKLKYKKVPVYFIEDLNADVANVIAVSINGREGQRVDREHRIEFALEAVKSKRLTTKDASKHFDVPQNTINYRIRQDRIAERAVAGGATREVNRSIRSAIGSVFKGTDRVLAELVDFSAKNKLGGAEAGQIAKDVSAFPTEPQQLAHINSVQRKLDKSSKTTGKTKLPLRTSFLRAMTQLGSVLSGVDSIEELQITKGSEDYENAKEDFIEQILKPGKKIFGIR